MAFSKPTSKKDSLAQAGDSTRCFTNAEMQVVNDAFIDLDDCQTRDSVNQGLLRKAEAIISKQDSNITTFKETIVMLKENRETLKSLAKVMGDIQTTANLKFSLLQDQAKSLSKQLWKSRLTTGITFAGGVTIAVAVPVIIYYLKK